MNELLAALAEIRAPRPVDVVSDTFAEHGLVRVIVRSDATVTVEIDPYAAMEVGAEDVERHLFQLVAAAEFPPPPEPEPERPAPESNADFIARMRKRKK